MADHPRAGGEHGVTPPEIFRALGSSPRWRGTRIQCGKYNSVPRIIPALAGNTRAAATEKGRTPDHPRAGGEHVGEDYMERRDAGSSPRWRGTLGRVERFGVGERIIPALAGNTFPLSSTLSHQTDHPRAGGEHLLNPYSYWKSIGSSPRWRGTHHANGMENHSPRIIPALAGNTTTESLYALSVADHPRAGGEHRAEIFEHLVKYGSSPRWRGTLTNEEPLAGVLRIIPALAGNTG